jgi:uncharacterized SAM-binding protein YcdF (DUF218 family)
MTEVTDTESPVLARKTTRPRSARRGAGRRIGRAAVLLAGVVCFALVLGFIDFAERIANAAPPANARAEGIVVLTGGAARIDGALQLLAEGRANRLLISGVNPAVTRDTLALTVEGDLRSVLDCCADLGRTARDTIGNAVETRNWAAQRGFSSLIVVTSDYHMPRSMSELGQAMPGKRLIAFPVSSPELDFGRWWRDPEAFSLLVREYGKFLLAETRQLLTPAGGGDRTAASAVAAQP